MSGERLLLDTNAIVALLKGSADLSMLTSGASWIGISVISELEFLCFPRLSNADETCFRRLLERVEVIGLGAEDVELTEAAIRIRKEHALRIPDAIIGATAQVHGAILVTADTDFSRVPDLPIHSFA